MYFEICLSLREHPEIHEPNGRSLAAAIAKAISRPQCRTSRHEDAEQLADAAIAGNLIMTVTGAQLGQLLFYLEQCGVAEAVNVHVTAKRDFYEPDTLDYEHQLELEFLQAELLRTEQDLADLAANSTWRRAS